VCLGRPNRRYRIEALVCWLSLLTILSVYVRFDIGFDVLGTVVYISTTRMTLILLGIVSISQIIRSGSIAILDSSLALILFFLFAALSSSWSWYPSVTLNRLVGVSLYLSLYVAVLVTPNRPQTIERWAMVVLYGGIFSIVVWNLAQIVEYEYLLQLRNLTGKRVVAFLPILYYFFHINEEPIQRGFYVLLGILGIVTVFSAGSRSGFIAIGGTVLLLSLVTYYKSDMKLFNTAFVFVLPVLVGLLIVASLFIGVFPERLLQIPLSLSQIGPETIGTVRYWMYQFFFRTFTENWVLGIGYGAFREAMTEQYIVGIVAHGIFLRVLAGMGIIGFLIFCYVILSSIREYLYAANIFGKPTSDTELLYLALASSLCGLLIAGSFNPIIREPSLFILLALSVKSFLTTHR